MPRRHRPRRWFRLNVIVWNTHVGAAVANGGLEWLLHHIRRRVHLILVQEVRHAVMLRRHLGDDWLILGGPDPGRDALPYVVARRSRFEVVDVEVDDITFGSRWARRTVVAALRDKRTRRLVFAQSVHVDPLGRGLPRANRRALDRQRRQLAACVDALEPAARNAEAVLLAGGDFNQDLDARLSDRYDRYSAPVMFSDLGMLPAHTLAGDPRDVRLDDLFARVTDDVRVDERRRLDPPVRGNDHSAVFVSLLVRRLRRCG